MLTVSHILSSISRLPMLSFLVENVTPRVGSIISNLSSISLFKKTDLPEPTVKKYFTIRPQEGNINNNALLLNGVLPRLEGTIPRTAKTKNLFDNVLG